MAVKHNDVPGLWFGTEQRMSWLPGPLTGADTSPEGWSAGGTLLSGGAYQRNSFGSHKRYQYSWSDASARETAQLMKSYADGTYGRGLIYFVDPLIYDMNVLPALWADPSTANNQEGVTHVYGLEPTAIPTAGWRTNNLPTSSAQYNLAHIEDGWRGKEQALFLPVPEGYTLALGAFYNATETGGVFYRTQDHNGTLGAVTQVPAMNNNSGVVVDTTATAANIAGVWIFVGKTAADSSVVTLTALAARLFKTSGSISDVEAGPWVGGMGHSGCAFETKPTYIEYSPIMGGQVGFAASFIEVGSWTYG